MHVRHIDLGPSLVVFFNAMSSILQTSTASDFDASPGEEVYAERRGASETQRT